MKYEKSCGAVVFNEKGEILIVTHRAGHTDFPKGHVERGETEEETARREVKEETNIDIELLPGRYSVRYFPKPNVDKTVIFFPAKKISGEIIAQEKEVSEVKWVSKEQIESYLTYESAKKLFRQILSDNPDL